MTEKITIECIKSKLTSLLLIIASIIIFLKFSYK